MTDTAWAVDEVFLGIKTHKRKFNGFDLTVGRYNDDSFFWFVIDEHDTVLDEGYKIDIHTAKKAAENVTEFA